MISGCSQSGAAPTAALSPAHFQNGVSAFAQICSIPASHPAVVKAAEKLQWRRLTARELPPEIAGNGTVDWSQAWASPETSPAMIVAVGTLGSTSFCRVYFRAGANDGLQQAVAKLGVLGSALGQPDFERSASGPAGPEDVVGWHRTAKSDWRAVHLTIFEKASASAPGIAPRVLEMTRAVG